MIPATRSATHYVYGEVHGIGDCASKCDMISQRLIMSSGGWLEPTTASECCVLQPLNHNGVHEFTIEIIKTIDLYVSFLLLSILRHVLYVF